MGLGGVLFSSPDVQLRAGPILQVINLGPILARHDIGNALGMSFDPQDNVLYLAHGSDPRGGFIDRLDLQGNLLNEFNLQRGYLPGAYLTSMSYDVASGHLFVVAVVPVGKQYASHLLEIDPDSFTVLTDLGIDTDGGGGIYVRGDDIWQARFSEDVIRHYSRALVFKNDISIASSFRGFGGPKALTSSFEDGFFLVDHFDERIVEVDSTGHEIAQASTAGFWDGRGFSIDVDLSTRRIYFQDGNAAIYVLSDEFIGGSTTPVPEPQTVWLSAGAVVIIGIAAVRSNRMRRRFCATCASEGPARRGTGRGRPPIYDSAICSDRTRGPAQTWASSTN
jgi:hypothetical protein